MRPEGLNMPRDSKVGWEGEQHTQHATAVNDGALPPHAGSVQEPVTHTEV